MSVILSLQNVKNTTMPKKRTASPSSCSQKKQKIDPSMQTRSLQCPHCREDPQIKAAKQERLYTASGLSDHMWVFIFLLLHSVWLITLIGNPVVPVLDCPSLELDSDVLTRTVVPLSLSIWLPFIFLLVPRFVWPGDSQCTVTVDSSLILEEDTKRFLKGFLSHAHNASAR